MLTLEGGDTAEEDVEIADLTERAGEALEPLTEHLECGRIENGRLLQQLQRGAQGTRGDAKLVDLFTGVALVEVMLALADLLEMTLDRATTDLRERLMADGGGALNSLALCDVVGVSGWLRRMTFQGSTHFDATVEAVDDSGAALTAIRMKYSRSRRRSARRWWRRGNPHFT